MEKNNYGFKFDPNNEKKDDAVKFSDANGKSTMRIESDGAPLNMPENVILANKPKTRVKTPTNIGKGSNGFAGVATLAIIIAVAGALIFYLTLRY